MKKEKVKFNFTEAIFAPPREKKYFPSNFMVLWLTFGKSSLLSPLF
jgi:hypothetical protein